MATQDNPLFFRAFMTAVFAGLAATVSAVLFDMVGAQVFYFPLSFVNNVSTLIFSVNILFPILGVLYYACLKLTQKGDLIFCAICLGLTGFYAVKAWSMKTATDPVLNAGIRDLFTGITLILGLYAAIAIPLFFHSKKFEETVV
jgi:hypothetical protein